MNKKEKKVLSEGIKECLQRMLEDMDEVKEQYPSFRSAIIGMLPDKAKKVIDKYVDDIMSPEAELVLAEGLELLHGDEVLADVTKRLLGIDLKDIKKATEQAMMREQHFQMLDEVSQISKISKTKLILSSDYSIPVEERIGKLKDFLDSFRETEG
jgi:hypothetical protein